MPNPFPGMDPYLEGPRWTTVHSNLVNEIARQLAPKLRPKYVALTEERIVVASPDPIEIAPKLRVADVGVYPTGFGQTPDGAAVATAPLLLTALIPERISQTFVEIRDTDEQRLVTAIEVLSPTNKRGSGLQEYRKKREEYLLSGVHYLEVDLLRIGERFPLAGPLPSVPYFVFVSRATRRPRVEVWPIPLEQPLPTVPVPLLPSDADVPLDLQEAIQSIYEWFSYEQVVDHSGEPTVPLAADQQAWAAARLRAAGLRA
ncbi:MAG: DUF4058 family protein [Planctomycetota bacterium]|nr:DUF4058 family protein [Planctomycetota bacterium]